MSFSIFEAISNAANFISNISDQLPWNKRNDPEWLKSIQGDFPLLGCSEWEYIAEVRHRIIREARPIPNIPPDQRLKNKLSVMKYNFEEVVSYLRRNSNRKDYFVRNYPSWRSYREESITQLKNIANAININRHEAAASREAGSSMSLVGGVMCLIPGIGALRLAGGLLVGLGSLAALATSFVELEKFRKKIKEAEEVMLQDKAYSEKLWNWMNDISHIQEAYKIIEDMDVDLNLKRMAFDLCGFFKVASKESTDGKCSLVTEDVKMFIAKAVFSLKFPYEMVTEVADVISMLMAVSMLHERYRPLFDLSFETYKFKRMLYTVGNVIATTAQMTAIVNASSKGSALTTFQKSRIGIGIALDIITIIQARKDMESVSKEAIEIKKAAEKLKKEADIFKKMYDAVKRVRAG